MLSNTDKVFEVIILRFFITFTIDDVFNNFFEFGFSVITDAVFQFYFLLTSVDINMAFRRGDAEVVHIIDATVLTDWFIVMKFK